MARANGNGNGNGKKRNRASKSPVVEPVDPVRAVLKLDDPAERVTAEIACRPSNVPGRSQLLFRGMKRLSENEVLNVKNKSHAVTAEIEVPERDAKGVIIAQGGSMGGWTLYVHEGRLKYCYNMMGAQYAYVGTDAPLPAGRHQVRMEMAYDGGLGKGGDVTLYVDGKSVGGGRVERTHPFGFSLDETTDVGCDLGSPVSTDYGPRENAFNGDVAWVQLEVGPEDVDHIIAAEERFQMARARP